MANEDTYEKINAAIAAHGAWKFKLREQLAKGTAAQIVDQAGDFNNCAFGTWLRSLPAGMKNQPEVAMAIKLHQQFHGCAKKIASESANGRKDAATQLLNGDFNQLSRDLTSAMTQWKISLRRAA